MAEQEALDSHDESVRIAYLPDTVKIHHEKGYPAPGVRQRLKDESSMYFELISAADLLNGCLLKRYRAHEYCQPVPTFFCVVCRGFTVLCIPGGFAPNTKNGLGEKGRALIEEFVRGWH